ncbi:MAG: tetratricopeptide repeat protein [Alphaproteobacteria bacterium]|nr:tetratricopeptide repeat protein [Alphaproteobacteria bacterium]
MSDTSNSRQQPVAAGPGAVRVAVSQAIARAKQLFASGDLPGAEAIAQSVLSQRPGHVQATEVLAAVAEKRSDSPRAIELLRSALTGGSADASLQMNLCRTYRQMGQLEDARLAGEAAISFGTKPEALADLADVYVALGENSKALECYETAIAKAPGFGRAHLGLAHALMMAGDYRVGFAEYEWRYRLPNTQRLLPNFKQPQWNGMTLRNSRLFVLCEQGYGDCFQFARYLPLAAERVRDVVVGVSAELKPVIERVAGPRAFYDRWETLPAFDFQITLSSLPHAMGTTLESIPASVPYLNADPAKTAVWRSRLAERANGRATVGLVWHGRPTSAINASRSVPLGALTPILELNDILPVSLQVGAGSEQLAQHPARPRVLDAGPMLSDFGETAALMTALDHIVTVETAAAHLAGGLGREAHVLLAHVADWRWLEKRSDSPWYPSLRLVRQERRGDWGSVVSRVVNDLQALQPGSGSA